MSAPLLKASQIADRLGMSISWVKAAAADGRIPCIRIPGPDGTTAALRFDQDEVDAWIDQARSSWRPGDTARATLHRAGGG